MLTYRTIATGSISAGNALIDSTTANAFAAPVGIDFTPYRGCRIEFWSGSTLWASAWVSGIAPGGDTLGSDMVTGWSNSNGADGVTPFDVFTPSGVDLYAKSLGSIRRCVSIGTVQTVGSLYKTTLTANIIGGSVSFRQTAKQPSGAGITYYPADAAIAHGSNTFYGTIHMAAYYGFDCDIAEFEISSYSTKQVTSPASTGALLLSSPGGSRGWEYKHASFNPNAALTYRIMTTLKVTRPIKYMGATTVHNA